MKVIERVIQWPLNTNIKDLVGASGTGIVARLDAVVKFYDPSDLHFMEREKLVYERLGHDHSGILRFFGAFDNFIILGFTGKLSIRNYLKYHERVPLSTKLRWVEEIFDAFGFVHSKGVLHGSISSDHVYLDDKLNAKLGEFAGSAIDDEPPLGCYEASHDLGHGNISIKTELFALGSTVYEIMTGTKPHEDLSWWEVEVAMSEGRFPDLNSLPAFRTTVKKCWEQKYASTGEALEEIKSEAATIKEQGVSSPISSRL